MAGKKRVPGSMRNPVGERRLHGMVRLAALMLLVLLVAVALDVRLRTVSYRVETAKVATPVRIALLTDLHGCRYGTGMSTLLAAVERQKPDGILFGGDIFDDRMPPDNARLLMTALAKRYACFYVTGNHEFWSGEAERIKQWVRDSGITVLEGQWADLAIRGERLAICGVDDPDGFPGASYLENEATPGGFADQLHGYVANLDPKVFSLLLSHRPERIREYAACGFDLVLSGHAHGGQWRVPGLVNGLLAPDQGWFPPYAGGRYDTDGTGMIVSRGLARESTRIPRVFNRPELVVVDIVPALRDPG